MIKQIESKEIIDYVKNNSKTILLDVRTKEEWEKDKPDGENIGLKTYFLSLLFEGGVFNKNFIEEFKNLNIKQDYRILIICGSGNRSQKASELLTEEGYNCLNIFDGFLGNNNEKIGWKNNQLPTK